MGEMEKSHPPQWRIQGRGPGSPPLFVDQTEAPPPSYLKVWIRHCDLSIESSRTVTFDQFRPSLGPSRFKIKIEDSRCKMLAI